MGICVWLPIEEKPKMLRVSTDTIFIKFKQNKNKEIFPWLFLGFPEFMFVLRFDTKNLILL